MSGYEANVYVEQAFNEPGCWLGADGWSDDKGFMLLPGNGCNDCFTTYLCSSNHGDYLAPPQPPVPAPAPITPVSTVDVCSSAGEFEYEGHTLYCLEIEGELHNILHIEDGAETCGFNDANSCPSGFDIWVPRSYEHARAVLSLRGYNGYDDDLDDAQEVDSYELRGYDKMLVGVYINSTSCGSCGGLALNSDVMATYKYGVTWQSVAGDPWFVRSTTYKGRPNEWTDRGQWPRMIGWTEGEGFDFMSTEYHARYEVYEDFYCYTSYYCSTNVARAAAPSPRPTVSQVTGGATGRGRLADAMRARPDSLRARRTRSRGRGAEKSADVRVRRGFLPKVP